MPSELISFVCVFDSAPSADRVVSAFELLADLSGQDDAGSEIDVAWWDENSSITSFRGDLAATIDAWKRSETITATVRFEGFELAVEGDDADSPLASIPHIRFSEQIHAFTPPEDRSETRERRRRRFAEAIGAAASLLEPEFGIGHQGEVTPEMIQQYRQRSAASHPPLYEYNLFSTETVESVGRERFITAPAWHVAELDSGGIFLVVRPPPQRCGPEVEDCIAVANHLGLSLPGSS